jgi:hypothetical protein
MSKKETRRAARQAYPKAKGGAPAKGGGGKSKAGAKSNVIKDASGRPLRPPTLKRAVIQGAILATLYFVVIEFIWVQKDPATGARASNTTTSLIIALAGFVIYTGVAYAVDKMVYQRKLRKIKGAAK